MMLKPVWKWISTRGLFYLPRSAALFLLWCFFWIWAAHAAPIPSKKLVQVPHFSPSHVLSSPIRLRVRLDEQVTSAIIRGFDLRIYEGQERVATLERQSEWEFRCQSDPKGQNGKVRAVSLKGGVLLDLHGPVRIESPTGFLSFQGRPYREVLRIYPTQTSDCEVVNEVDMEKYLDGLVNAEFSAKWNEQAVEAQVIAARTYAYYQLLQARKNPASHYDLDATVKDQVYDGAFREDYRASRAAGRTKGWILTAEGGEPHLPIKAFYHSTCGGKTLLPEVVWGSRYVGLKRAVSCPFCRGAPASQWSLDLSSDEISEAWLRGAEEEEKARSPASSGFLHWPRLWKDVLRRGQLKDLQIIQADGSRRMSQVRGTWVSDRVISLTIPIVRFRAWIGATRVRSSAFRLSPMLGPMGRGWHLEGSGYGHGVGLCQWGAKGMGERGYAAREILGHYYPDARMKKIW